MQNRAKLVKRLLNTLLSYGKRYNICQKNIKLFNYQKPIGLRNTSTSIAFLVIKFWGKIFVFTVSPLCNLCNHLDHFYTQARKNKKIPPTKKKQKKLLYFRKWSFLVPKKTFSNFLAPENLIKLFILLIKLSSEKLDAWATFIVYWLLKRPVF